MAGPRRLKDPEVAQCRREKDACDEEGPLDECPFRTIAPVRAAGEGAATHVDAVKYDHVDEPAVRLPAELCLRVDAARVDVTVSHHHRVAGACCWTTAGNDKTASVGLVAHLAGRDARGMGRERQTDAGCKAGKERGGQRRVRWEGEGEANAQVGYRHDTGARLTGTIHKHDT